MADAAVPRDVHATVEHSERFHRLIIEASGNQLLETVWGSLSITDHTALTMVTLFTDLNIVPAVASADRRCDRGRRHRAGVPGQSRASGLVRGAACRHGREGPAAPVRDLGLRGRRPRHQALGGSARRSTASSRDRDLAAVAALAVPRPGVVSGSSICGMN